MTRLRLNKTFVPCGRNPGDEIYPNGIFEFNITKLLAFIAAKPDAFPVESIDLRELPFYGSEHLNEKTIRAANLSVPILLAEISPERFNVIDGHHRVARARREQLSKMRAYRIGPEHHIRFLTSVEAYVAYVKYWNENVKLALRTAR